MTFAVDWVLKANDLSISVHILGTSVMVMMMDTMDMSCSRLFQSVEIANSARSWDGRFVVCVDRSQVLKRKDVQSCSY